MMRVAYVCVDAGIPIFGQKGASVHIQEVIRALIKRGIEVEVFAARSGDKPPSDLQKAPVYEVSGINDALRKAIAERGRFDFIYERYSLSSFAALDYARKQGIPGVLEVNAPLIEEQIRYRALKNRSAAKRLTKQAFAAAQTVIAVSVEAADYVRGYLSAVDSKKVFVVPNGVNPQRFAQKTLPAFPAAPDTFTVGFVGSLKLWHGVANLIEAFEILHKKIPNSRLLIVGEGPLRQELAKDLSLRGLSEKAHFTGIIMPELIPGYMASMDVGAAPYPLLPQFYFSPLKIFEYMAAGLAVAASDIGQIKTIIKDEETGLLVSPGDPKALAEALYRLQSDPELRRSLGQRARLRVLERYTWDKIVEQILEIAMDRKA